MIQLDPIRHRERRHYFFDDEGYLWVRTSVAADYFNIDHVTLNRDCRLACNAGEGNLAGKEDYIMNREGQWWVRQDLDDIYTMLAPGKAGQGIEPSWIYVKDLQVGPRP